jgi:small GTP-binding protein
MALAASEKTDLTFKILTIGESGVGKTCLLLRYTDNKFVKNHLTTIGIDFKAKILHMLGKSIKLKIWDTAGQERFRNITQQYYKGADGIILVFDVTDRNSFEKVSEWMLQIKNYTQIDKIGIILLGNKVDLEPREVKPNEGEELAKQFNIKYFETSAFSNYRIDESFLALTEEIMQKKNIDLKDNGGTFNINERNIDNQENKKKSCC